VILLPLYFIVRTTYHIRKWNEYGTGGYNTKAWAQNGLIKFLKDKKPHGVVLSNNIYALSYHVNFKPDQAASIIDLKEKTPKYDCQIVYFSPEYRHSSAKNDNFVFDEAKAKILYKGREGLIIQK
jgi:hypothetical protein